MTVEACPDIEAAVERVGAVAKSKLALLEAITDVYPGMRTSKCPDLRSDLLALLSERKALRGALGRIERWFGEFPETGDKWEDGSPVSYATLYGSNGERDYMRGIARQALKGDADVSR